LSKQYQIQWRWNIYREPSPSTSRVTWSILTTKVNIKNTFTSHIDKKYFWHFCWLPNLYTFSLYQYAEITIHKHYPDCKPTKSALNTATNLIKQKHQQIMEHKKKTVTYGVGISRYILGQAQNYMYENVGFIIVIGISLSNTYDRMIRFSCT
jgi:hypothetical protein